MNKYIQQMKYIIFLVVLTGLFSSCNDDFLERYPLTNISDGGFWNTANDLQLYCNNFYQQFFNNYSGYETPFTADAENGSDSQVFADYNRWLNGENQLPSTGGGWDWGQLRNVNYFLDNYTRSPEPWDNIKSYVGEALFFRSYFYFNRLKRFGDLPFYSHVLQMDSEDLFAARLPRNQVVDSIMYDLDRAVEYLPERGTWAGRILKETAMLLQARIALYEGTWEKYHDLKNTPFKVTGSDGSKYIRKAAEVAGALMALAEANGNTGLNDLSDEFGYTDLFIQRNYGANKEVLLWREFSIAENVTSLYTEVSASGRGASPTKSLIDSYLCLDGKPISVSSLYQGDATVQTVVTNRDPRLYQTICVNDGKHYRWKNENTFYSIPSFEDANYRNATGYQLYKGHPQDYGTSRLRSEVGKIYFRYAEALLIYAEARAELGEITQSDIDKTVNALRRRVGMDEGLLDMTNITTDLNWEFKGISPLLNEIRRERKVELACEGFRCDDILRWAAIDELILGKRPRGAIKEQWTDFPGASEIFLTTVAEIPVDENGYIDRYQSYPAMSNGYRFNLERDYLWPLPVSELNLNSALKQNPGWE